MKNEQTSAYAAAEGRAEVFYAYGDSAVNVAKALLKKVKSADATSLMLSVDWNELSVDWNDADGPHWSGQLLANL